MVDVLLLSEDVNVVYVMHCFSNVRVGKQWSLLVGIVCDSLSLKKLITSPMWNVSWKKLCSPVSVCIVRRGLAQVQGSSVQGPKQRKQVLQMRLIVFMWSFVTLMSCYCLCPNTTFIIGEVVMATSHKSNAEL